MAKKILPIGHQRNSDIDVGTSAKHDLSGNTSDVGTARDSSGPAEFGRITVSQSAAAPGTVYLNDSTLPNDGVLFHEDLLQDLQQDPSILDRYRLQATTEIGGMGIVYQAIDQQLSQLVAIKVLRSDRRDSFSAVSGFANESRMMAYVDHPGIVPIYHCGKLSDDRPFFVMKHIAGCTLAEIISENQTSLDEMLRIFSDLCQVVACAHERGVAHLDLKPRNIMIGPRGEVYLVDWGLARFFTDMPEDFRANAALVSQQCKDSTGINGTFEYMSPEQANGDAVDSRADVFSLGAILCELMTHFPPYTAKQGRSAFQQAHGANLKNAFKALKKCGACPDLIRLAKVCLSQSKDRRPENAREVADAITAIRNSSRDLEQRELYDFLDASLELFCVVRTDGSIERVNNSMAQVLGYRTEAMLAQSLSDLVHPDERPQLNQIWKSLLAERAEIRFQTRFLCADQSVVPVQWNARLLQSKQAVYAIGRTLASEAGDST